MRFMVIVKAPAELEAMGPPDPAAMEAMGKYNEELVKAGILLAADGLQPSSKGAKVRFKGDKRTVIDGPFTESKELIGGYWIFQCRSLEECIEWVKRCPGALPDIESEIEIRPMVEMTDFDMPPEVREKFDQMAAQIAANNRS
ncbi:MAG: YciI family protein [Kofleriaceae bacterium]|nr:YciI family protein [Kofleriaceae bacterium]